MWTSTSVLHPRLRHEVCGSAAVDKLTPDFRYWLTPQGYMANFTEAIFAAINSGSSSKGIETGWFFSAAVNIAVHQITPLHGVRITCVFVLITVDQPSFRQDSAPTAICYSARNGPENTRPRCWASPSITTTDSNDLPDIMRCRSELPVVQARASCFT